MDAATAIRRYREITRRGPIACSEEEDKERRELAEWMSKNLPGGDGGDQQAVQPSDI